MTFLPPDYFYEYEYRHDDVRHSEAIRKAHYAEQAELRRYRRWQVVWTWFVDRLPCLSYRPDMVSSFIHTKENVV